MFTDAEDSLFHFGFTNIPLPLPPRWVDMLALDWQRWAMEMHACRWLAYTLVVALITVGSTAKYLINALAKGEFKLLTQL